MVERPLPQRLIDAATSDLIRSGGRDAEFVAATICLQARAPVIARVLAADPIEHLRVELTRDDIDHLFAMSAQGQARRPLLLDAEGRASGSDDENKWTRNRIKQQQPVQGPFFAVGRGVPGDLTILDGLHRAAVWLKHADAGLHYPMTVNVSVTSRPVWFEGV